MAQSSKKAKPKTKKPARAKPKAGAKAKKPKKAKATKAKRTAKQKALDTSVEESPKSAPEEARGAAEEASKDDTEEPTKVLSGEVAATAEDTSAGAGVNGALAAKAALAGTRAAGRAVGVMASKAKGPIVVGGGLAAGAIGGLALVRRRNDASSTGPLDPDRVIGAVRRAGTFGEELGRMATLMEQANAGSRRKRK